jgi:hypothetical protein
MKHILLMFCIVAVSCCTSPKKTTEPPTGETGKIQNPVLEAIPVCISKLIDKYQHAPKENPPRKAYSYTYKGQTVYYFTPPCCDMYSDLYDGECKLLGHPDGGITGKGDGTLPEFSKMASNEQLLWEDTRK